MRAFNYITCVTDLLNATPRIKDLEKELCENFDDFIFGKYLRFMGIKGKYPTAEFFVTDTGCYILVEGVLVYESDVLAIDSTPIEVSESE